MLIERGTFTPGPWRAVRRNVITEVGNFVVLEAGDAPALAYIADPIDAHLIAADCQPTWFADKESAIAAATAMGHTVEEEVPDGD